MPKIFEYCGIIFYFYANEHLPIHVHAEYAGCETIFEIIYYEGKVVEIKKRKSKGRHHLPKNILKEAEAFVSAYSNEITDKWNDFFVLKKKVSSETLKKIK